MYDSLIALIEALDKTQSCNGYHCTKSKFFIHFFNAPSKEYDYTQDGISQAIEEL